MPLLEPPPVASLGALPTRGLAATVLHRVFLTRRESPWWFSGVPAGADPDGFGRFDLPHPEGACYLATTPVAAVLETFQHLVGGLLPDDELRRRSHLTVTAPPGSPRAANLTAARARAAGVTYELFSSGDRALSQRWAVRLRRAGFRALVQGVRHDPTGRLRAVTLFDTAGDHPPYDDAEGWVGERTPLHHDAALRSALSRYGIRVTRSDPQLPVVPLEDSGLL